MVNITFSRDFNSAFDDLFDMAASATSLTTQTNKISFFENDSSGGSLTSFAANYEGFFTSTFSSGLITSVGGEFVDFGISGDPFVWRLDVSGFAVGLTEVFTFSSGFYTYDDTDVKSAIVGKTYAVTGMDTPDIIVSTAQFALDGADTFVMNKGNDTVRAGAGNDTIEGGEGKDVLYGQLGHDKIKGGMHNDRLYGAFGNDTLVGDNGYDLLFGDGGADKLFGGNGADKLRGGDGRDTLTGGGGKDKFFFGTDTKTDVVKDFTVDIDKIVTTNASAFEDLTLKRVKAGVLVTDGDVKLLLEGLLVKHLDADDFIF